MDIQDVILADFSGFARFNIDAAPLAGLFQDRDMDDQLVLAVVAIDMEKRLAAESGQDPDILIDHPFVAGAAGDGFFQVFDDFFEFREMHKGVISVLRPYSALVSFFCKDYLDRCFEACGQGISNPFQGLFFA